MDMHTRFHELNMNIIFLNNVMWNLTRTYDDIATTSLDKPSAACCRGGPFITLSIAILKGSPKHMQGHSLYHLGIKMCVMLNLKCFSMHNSNIPGSIPEN